MSSDGSLYKQQIDKPSITVHLCFFSAAGGAKMRVCVMLFVVLLLLNGALSESQRDDSVIIGGKGCPNYPYQLLFILVFLLFLLFFVLI